VNTLYKLNRLFYGTGLGEGGCTNHKMRVRTVVSVKVRNELMREVENLWK